MRKAKHVAEFIRTMTVELTDLARGADLPALGFILTLASLEAKRTAETPRDRSRRTPQRRDGIGASAGPTGRPHGRRMAARQRVPRKA